MTAVSASRAGTCEDCAILILGFFTSFVVSSASSRLGSRLPVVSRSIDSRQTWTTVGSVASSASGQLADTIEQARW